MDWEHTWCALKATLWTFVPVVLGTAIGIAIAIMAERARWNLKTVLVVVLLLSTTIVFAIHWYECGK
jgi:ABC-type sugar transport system permease subunit